jgi:segregation and condensation protein A
MAAPKRPARSLPELPAPRPADDDTMSFRVDLDIFRGPLDLLLYLVRKHELSVTDIPIAPITEQFLDHMAVLEHLDINVVGDFLEMASILIEIKSKLLLPQEEETGESEEPWEDPREQLVQQLLEYKQYRDAASILEERGRNWSQCFTRLSNDLPPRDVDPASQPIQEVELWDLVSAMGRIIRASEMAQPTNIVYDDTPIHVYMQRIHERLREDGQVAFSDMFQSGMHKSAMIGVFLAVLELVRHHCVYAEQDGVHGEIYLMPGTDFTGDLPLDDVDQYEGAVKPR